MKNKVTVVFVLLLIGTAAARADSIIYQFTDFLVPGGFTYVTPTFITTTITVPASDLTACTSSGGPILSGCSGVIFKPNSDSADSIEFLRGGFG